jgi:uncharacterized protein
MTALNQIHTEIEARVDSIRAQNPDWLCRRGCSGCCHRLAEMPQLSAAEWALLQEGLATLSPELLETIRHNMAMLAIQKARPLVCPFLDQAIGSCLVYAFRPIACRTYGFYVQRDQGLYCKDIEALETNGALNHVVWGNQDAIDHQLNDTGEMRDLTTWFSEWNNVE